MRRLKTAWVCLMAAVLCIGTVLIPQGKSQAQAAPNPVANPGFEQVTGDGSIPGWKQTYGAGSPELVYRVTDEDRFSGHYSLYLEDPSNTKTLGVESEKFPVTEGKTYSASAMFQVERSQLGIYLQFYNEAGVRISNTAGWIGVTDGAWVMGSVAGTAPEGAVAGSVLLYSSSTGQGKGFIDDVFVEEIRVGTFELLGQPITNFIHMDSAIGYEDNRLVSYTVVKGADDQTVFAVVDLLSAEVIKTFPMPGVTGAWAVKMSSDGKIYAATHYNASLYQYTPGSDTIVNLGRLGSESHAWSMAAGPDGKMYVGTYPNAHVFEYDPATNQIRDLGRVHPTEKYVRSMAYDPERNMIYAGVGGTNAGIVKVHPADGSFSDDLLSQWLPETHGQYTFPMRIEYALGKLFIRLTDPDHLLIADAATETVEFYDPGSSITLGQAVVTKPGDESKVYFGGYILRSYHINTRTFQNEYPDPDKRWVNFQHGKFVDLNDPEWPGLTLAAVAEKGKIMLFNQQTGRISESKIGNFGSPVLIQSLHTGFDGNIYIGGYLGASGFNSYRPDDGTFTPVQEFGQVESVASVGNKLFIGTYGHSRIHEYDPALPWSSTNPRRIADLSSYGQDRPFAAVGVDSLSKLYVGSVADYGSHQGALAVYDVASRQIQVFRNIVKDQGIVSLAYKDGFLYGGTTIYGGLGTSGPVENEGKLFVFDTATNTKVMEIVPVPGRKVVSGLLAGPDGMIWGVAEDHIFKFDPVSRKVVYTAAKLGRYGTATVWVDAFLEIGKDGNVYGTNRQKTFFMIRPETMEFIVIKNGAGNYLRQDFYGNLYMANDANLWKYTLPADEETLSAALEKAYADGHLPHPVYMQLTNQLRQALHHRESGRQEQAVKHLLDMLSHLHNPEFDSSIAKEVKLPLDQQTRTLIENWR